MERNLDFPHSLNKLARELGVSQRTLSRICKRTFGDPRWPELVHPVASAIDTPLPEAPEVVHIMLGSKPAWVRVDDAGSEACHELYPLESLEEWHQRHGLMDDE